MEGICPCSYWITASARSRSQRRSRTKSQPRVRRLAQTYQDGLVTDKEYKRRRDQLQAKAKSLIVPDDALLVEYGLQLENLAPYFQEAADAEKAELSHLLLDAVYANLETGRIVKIKPAIEFLAIFRMAAEKSNWQEVETGVFAI